MLLPVTGLIGLGEKPPLEEVDFYFYGVEIEYIVSEKILAVSSELPRPVKHLVDLYSLTKIDLRIDILKKYLIDGLNNENLVRGRFNKPLLKEDYIIKDDKRFTGNFIMQTISAGYNVSFKKMRSDVNEWVKTTL